MPTTITAGGLENFIRSLLPLIRNVPQELSQYDINPADSAKNLPQVISQSVGSGPLNKIKIVKSHPKGKADVIAYVSTVDVNDDGKNDIINIVEPVASKRFSEYFNKPLSGEALANAIKSLSEVLVHEASHLGPTGVLYYDPKSPTGGMESESVARMAEKGHGAIDSFARNIDSEILKKAKAIKILNKLASQVSNREIIRGVADIITKTADSAYALPTSKVRSKK
jgi:hypothetical protein